jgi:hypothetical protein
MAWSKSLKIFVPITSKNTTSVSYFAGCYTEYGSVSFWAAPDVLLFVFLMKPIIWRISYCTVHANPLCRSTQAVLNDL